MANALPSSAIPSETPTLRDARSEVDIVSAEQAFHRLERELSRESREARDEIEEKERLKLGYDVEKAQGAPEAAQFDLREYLSSTNDAHQKAGLRHKHVGVTWEDLQVDVFGGINHRVRDCLCCVI